MTGPGGYLGWRPTRRQAAQQVAKEEGKSLMAIEKTRKTPPGSPKDAQVDLLACREGGLASKVA